MYPSALRRRSSRRNGATTVEFALTVPILFMLVMASIEFSRVNVLINSAKVAASEGARRGIVIGTTADEIEQVVLDELAVVGIGHADVYIKPDVVTDNTDLVAVGVSVPLDHRNGYVIPRFFVGDYAFKITAVPREAKKDPLMSQRLLDAHNDMLRQMQLDAANQ